jgi:enoyl-CoA hydratase/carnithine racemase
VITLNRPRQLKALSPELMEELGRALAGFDADVGVGAIVITGNEQAFAAGADIAAMKDLPICPPTRPTSSATGSISAGCGSR